MMDGGLVSPPSIRAPPGLDCQVQLSDDGDVRAGPTTDRGRQTRQRIVAAAADVVADKGAVGASLDEVGVRAGASRSQLYHYFDD